MDIYEFFNSDWASCPTTLKSTNGFVVFFGKNLISWTCQKHKTIGYSSIRAEYKDLHDVVAKVTRLV